MIINNGLGCSACGVEEGLTGILEGLGQSIYQEEEALQSAVNTNNAGAYQAAQMALENSYQGQAVIPSIASAPMPFIPATCPGGYVASGDSCIAVSTQTGTGTFPPANVATAPSQQQVVPSTTTPLSQNSQVIQQATSTTGTVPVTTNVPPAPFSPQQVVFDWLGLSVNPSASLIEGIPNWLLVAAGLAGVFVFGGGSKK
jgi:hypothetical protein